MTDKKQKFNLAMIRNLANIINETNLTELEVDSDGTRIRLLRSQQKSNITGYCSQENEEYSLKTSSSSTEKVNEESKSNNTDQYPINNHMVNSPMVGTAYLASKPGASPFVEEGSLVTKGQTLLIIEAMKTMNHIVSPYAGKVHDITVKMDNL
ncbi:Biotin carboxyl carrier protein [Candidatus Liberibacter americanus str. Sao Paulo]|uniref:Biotin carboxyl carrier protein of acetyl-CoA carboxylase n=1 Tax=Candidatus Liberibacter americanus str. Sao Paulo TaxID=1261131 RepID=U6B8V0_9HYPH|nr:acetyl-CoA carboxylase biotin carboxyl carrier protein subunit [Candidatus Liberibacter americanus]AHA28281.1 Biotin carboxyl carrier protein [Candidatus Liberibacter americanus str. Sao Paulo]